jgi:hypothetical protein
MALGESTNNKTYLGIFDGSFTLKVKPETPGAIKRTNKLGKEVWERRFGFVDGYLSDLKVELGEYGKQWSISLKDGDDIYVLKTEYSGGNSFSILNRLLNADLSKKIKLEIFIGEGTKPDQKRTVILLKQDDKLVPTMYSKEHQGDCPQMKQILVKGVLTWDDSERAAFMEQKILSEITPKIPTSFQVPHSEDPFA